MPSLLITIVFLQVLIHLFNTIGVSALNNFAWYLYNLLPTPTSRDAQTQRTLQATFLSQRVALNAISSQDEFAKWAKLRRQHDKTLAELEKLNAALKTSRTSFDRYLTATRWLSTNGLRLLLQFWCARRPVFWLPTGWVPAWVEWALAFPKAPRGSVSVQVWFMACTTVVTIIGESWRGTQGLWVTARTGGRRTEKPVTGAGPPVSESLGKMGNKKEL